MSKVDLRIQEHVEDLLNFGDEQEQATGDLKVDELFEQILQEVSTGEKGPKLNSKVQNVSVNFMNAKF